MLDLSKRNMHLVKRNQGSPSNLIKEHVASKTHATKEVPHEAPASVEDEYSDDVALDRKTNKTVVKRSGSNRVLETAVFLDAAAYNK